MSERLPVLCDSHELAVECSVVAATLGITIEPLVEEAPLASAAGRLTNERIVAVVFAKAPTVAEIVALQRALQHSHATVMMVVLGNSPEAIVAREVGSDVGLVTLSEIRPLLAALALHTLDAKEPWAASIRTLSTADRARLRSAVQAGGHRVSGHLLKHNDLLIGWSATATDAPRCIGSAADVALAIAALRSTNPSRDSVESALEGVDERAVTDVIFGPARALSDPASKAALMPYGIPLPNEELCSSASRASAEATRLGFPVRIALASPDLRVWQHHDLIVDMVDNAARVRETFRLLTALAQSRAPAARILGVTVAATTDSYAQLKAVLRPLPTGHAEATIGFADAHGSAAQDATTTVLPAADSSIERVLHRLQGASLVLSGSSAQRRTAVAEISDVLLRAAAFVTRYAREVVSVELRPIALLTGGGVEVREACVTVSDAFEQSYERASGLG